MQDDAPPMVVPGGVKVATFSRKLARSPHVGRLLDATMVLWPWDRQCEEAAYVVGWGRKGNTARAQTFAARHNLPYVRLEDGFVRSVGLGVTGAPAYSLVVDPIGMYYDARSPSLLEQLLERPTPQIDHALTSRAQACMEMIVEHGLSKYNDTPTRAPALKRAQGRKRVLLVDQTAGDLSLRYGGLSEHDLAEMVRCAQKEHPGARLLVKSHPDVTAGKRSSALLRALSGVDVEFIAAACNPIALLQQVDHVYVGTSQLGFEALLCGRPVTCFGQPFYAGWGLTDDRKPIARRTRRRELAEVFAAAYLLYARYLDPETREPGQLEDVLAHMARQREMFKANARAFVCVGFQAWKHRFVRAYLRSPDGNVHFAGRPSTSVVERAAGTTRVVWGVRDRLGGPRDQTVRVEVLRMEDGFLRSTGLGSDLTVPASLIVDGRGIYYDPSRPSDLEHLLQHHEFTPAELQRAGALQARIVEAGISKYNPGSARPLRTHKASGRTVVLVPGQVETDASIKLGCRDVRSNLALLEAVRAARPDAYVLYKPHPDVLSYNRRGAVHRDAAQQFCDELVTDVHISACLDAVDEVHTMTSLVGFESLLRGLPVYTYGMPFYAGWGLTFDRHTLERRTRKLTLEMLVAGALLRYPRYVHPETLEFITAEGVVRFLERSKRDQGGSSKSLLVRQAKRLMRSLGGAAGVQ